MVKTSGIKAVLLCLLLQVLIVLACQSQFTDLLGTDAYYLVVQAQAVLNTGSLKIPDGDPVPFIMATIMRLGITGEEAFRITIAITHGLMITSLASLFLRQGWGRRAMFGYLALVVGESIGLYHVFEFPKLSFAVTTLFAAIAVYRLFHLSEIVSIGLFATAVLIHPAVLPIVILSLGYLAYSDDRFSKYRSAIYMIFAGAIALSVVYFLLRQGNGILDRYREASGGPGLAIFMGRGNIPRFLQVEVCCVMVLLVGALCFSLVERRYGQVSVYGALLLLTMLPASTGEMYGLGERMVLLVAITALPIASVMAIRTPNADVSGDPNSRGALIAITTVCITSLWVPSVFSKALSTVNYMKLRAIVEKAETREPDILVAQRSLSFYYTALSGRDAFMFEPDPDWDRHKIWRVVFDMDVDEILYFAPAYCSLTPDLIENIPRTDAILIREDCWESFRTSVPKDDLPGLWDRVWDNEMNPSKARPKFLKERHSTTLI